MGQFKVDIETDELLTRPQTPTRIENRRSVQHALNGVDRSCW